MTFKSKKEIELENDVDSSEEELLPPNHTETIIIEELPVESEDIPAGSTESEDETEECDTHLPPPPLLKHLATPTGQPPPSPPPTPTTVIRNIKGRQRNPENWKVSVRKRLRQAGQEYVNASGKVVGQRKLRATCGTTCYHSCNDHFDEEQRQRIHDAFWRLTDEQKNYFYWKYTSRVEPKRRRKRATITKKSHSDDEGGETMEAAAASRRVHTLIYRFEVRGEMFTVCSIFFFGTLDITARRVYYFYENFYDAEACMPIPAQPHARKSRKKPKPTVRDLGKRLEALREHIASFPSTRYSGSTKKRYLAADLNITRMYKMYAESATDPLKQHWYNKVFNSEFNLGFRGLKPAWSEERRAAYTAKKTANSVRPEMPAQIVLLEEQPHQVPAAVASIQPTHDDACIPMAPTVAQPIECPTQYSSYNWLNGFETYNNYQ